MSPYGLIKFNAPSYNFEIKEFAANKRNTFAESPAIVEGNSIGSHCGLNVLTLQRAFVLPLDDISTKRFS